MIDTNNIKINSIVRINTKVFGVIYPANKVLEYKYIGQSGVIKSMYRNEYSLMQTYVILMEDDVELKLTANYFDLIL